MSSVFLSLGSNLSPERYVPACIETLKRKFKVKKISSVYETDPVGAAGKEKFWNLAAEVDTDLDRAALSRELRQIEESLGRKRDPSNKFAPRTIDIDILPQPDYCAQGFIMIPLAEIAPEAKDSETGRPFREYAEKFTEEKQTCRIIRLGK